MPDHSPNPPPHDPHRRGWRRYRDRAAAMLSPAWWMERKHRPAVLAALLVLVIVGGVLAYEDLKRPGDIRNTAAAFEGNEAKLREKTVNWPLYGYNRARTRYLAAKGLKPPFKRLWKYGDRPLLEFPPIYVRERLFLLDNNGHALALDADTGKVLWKRRVGRLNASSPTYARHRLFVVNLEPGQVLALNERNGKTEWKKELGSRSESSPLVVRNRVFFGDEGGTLHAVDRRNGNTIWRSSLCGAIKAAPAYRDGTLFVGDYGGCMSAVNTRNGAIRWQTSSQGLGFGSTGAFYSTPAVAFGRVYSGNNDHRVYSFDAKDGTVAWSHSTGGYVYSGPAVADTPNTGPTVYIGSLDGNAYAINAKTGETRWSRSVGGRILGSLSAVGNIVYAGTYEGTTTYGFAMRKGRTVFKYGTGGANSPAISDGQRIYLTGYSSVTALQPLTRKQIRKRRAVKRERAKKAAARKQHRRRAAAQRQRRRKAAAQKQGRKGGEGKKQERKKSSESS
ncbi:MAG: PQQ-binding-like beta-propeller repeat protein [Solirubrobacterales bacterium]